MVKTYRARRRQHMTPGVYREPGQLIPEAVTWPRVEAHVHTGHLTVADVEPDDLIAAVEEFCPELAERILELSGMAEGVTLHGPHRTPRLTGPVASAGFQPGWLACSLKLVPAEPVSLVKTAPVQPAAVLPAEPVTAAKKAAPAKKAVAKKASPAKKTAPKLVSLKGA